MLPYPQVSGTVTLTGTEKHYTLRGPGAKVACSNSSDAGSMFELLPYVVNDSANVQIGNSLRVSSLYFEGASLQYRTRRWLTYSSIVYLARYRTSQVTSSFLARNVRLLVTKLSRYWEQIWTSLVLVPSTAAWSV